jgi:hypothetical protein
MADPSPQDRRFAVPGSPGGSSSAFPRWSVAQRDAGVDPMDPSPLLLPGPDESPVAYLERLKALHRRLGSLITTIEQRREMRPGEPPRSSLSASLAAARPPAPIARAAAPVAPPRPAVPPLAPEVQPYEDDGLDWPAHERRVSIERRIGAIDRRIGLRDRRRGAIDQRAVRTERRTGPRDRRIGSADRRRGIDRRGEARREPWQRGGLRLDRTVVVWMVQVAAWMAIAAVALVYGLGHS